MDSHVITLVADDYDTSTSLLIDSDKEQIVFLTDITPTGGIWSGKQYPKQYNTIDPDYHQPCPSKDPFSSTSALEPLLDKNKPK